MVKTDFEMFERSWLEEIDKLDKGMIDRHGAQQLYRSFHRDELWFTMRMPSTESSNITPKIKLLNSKLTRAVEMAHARYDLQNKNLSLIHI
mgnify:CR=1 FL=1